jgi:hypothetical protein
VKKIDRIGKRVIMMNEEMHFIDNQEGTKDKITEAKALIKSSKDLISEVDSAIAECQIGVSKAADGFDTQKLIFINKVFRNSEELLQKVGIKYRTNSKVNEHFELSVESNSENIEIAYTNSGRLVGIFLSILLGMVTFLSWIYLALWQLNLPIEKSSLTLKFLETHRDTVLAWIGGGILKRDGEPMIGALVLGFSVLIIGWIIYALYLQFKTDKNLRIAKKAYIESQAYLSSTDESKKKMLIVDAHLRDIIISIENFTIMLNEQNAILQRIVYVEGIANENKRYHPSSTKVMRETERLMKSIEILLYTSITQKGKLNLQSQKVLAIAKATYADFTAKIYD